MLNHQEQSAFTDGRVENHLEVLEQLFEAFDCPVAQDQLYAVLLQIFLLNFANDALEVDYHYHFVFVSLAATKIEAPALRLVNALSARLQKLLVVDEVCESVRSVFFHNHLALDTVIGASSLLLLKSCLLLLKLMLVVDLLRQVDCILLFCLVEFDQFSLQGFSDLHLSEWLLMSAAHLDALCVIDCLGECTGTIRSAFRSARNVKVGAIVETVAAFPPSWIGLLLLGRGEPLDLLSTIVGDVEVQKCR